MDQQRIPNPEHTEQILNVFATRAAADLERQYSELAINRQLAAIEAAIDGIGILQNEVYLHVNQAYLNLFGYDDPAELIDQGWHLLYDPEEVARLERDVFPMLRQQGAWQGEAIATRKDGSTFAQGLSLTLTDDGLLISVCRDISDLKETQALITHNALHDPLPISPIEPSYGTFRSRHSTGQAFRFAIITRCYLLIWIGSKLLMTVWAYRRR